MLMAVCNYPLGMEDGRIQNSQLTASSQWDATLAPAHARLNGETGAGAWHPAVADTNEWIQVDLLETQGVSGIVLQGRAFGDNPQYTQKYRVKYSDDDSSWMWVTDDNQEQAKVRRAALGFGVRGFGFLFWGFGFWI